MSVPVKKRGLSSISLSRSAVCGMLLFAGTAYAQSGTSIFSPAATPAHSIFNLSMLVLSVTAVIFLIVGGLLLYALIRYRSRPDDSPREPAQIYGSNQIELSWTVIPILIVVMLFLSTTRVILGTESIPKPASAVDVIVIGHQYWWEYRYIYAAYSRGWRQRGRLHAMYAGISEVSRDARDPDLRYPGGRHDTYVEGRRRSVQQH